MRLPSLAITSRLLPLALAATAASAQPSAVRPSAPHSAHAAPRADSVPVYDDLGSYSRRIGTRSAAAQRYFDQGLRLTYGFGHPEGQRAFRAAIDADSACAMCQWGLAWSLGPYINGPTVDSAAAVDAHAAIQRAVALKASASPVERALIDAMATRYAAVPTRANRSPLDSAYVVAMRDVVRRFPNDLDAASLLGEALMVLRPWDQWTRVGEPKPGTEEVLRVLESVLKRDIRHPGACHHYIHATEASREPERAAACADLLGKVIPGASHIPHMPSHTYMRIGRYGDAVRANQDARLADQRSEHGGAPPIYLAHNTHMLASSAVMDGQSAIAMQAAADLAREAPASAFYQRVVLARFGRWTELLALPPLTATLPAVGMSAFGRGMAQLGLGRADSASAQLRVLDGAIAATTDSMRFRRHSQKVLLQIARAVLAGEIEARAARYPAAIAALVAALPLEDSLSYSEPEPWPIPLRHVLGAVLLESGDAAQAETVYREELRIHPANGWSLDGLERALRAQGRTTDADAVRRQKLEAWKRADVILTGSRVKP